MMKVKPVKLGKTERMSFSHIDGRTLTSGSWTRA